MFEDDYSSGCDDTSSFNDDSSCCEDCFGDINPTSGLPMDDCTGIDEGGYVYGDGPDMFS